ncbi:RrF2 family transcriptional regulator [Ureibacillus sinduriensis]|uniref:HTH-type transcriptional regulator NsrR n=1 Tax=Ureibacillus sinduriensis BLB-1 = JCM 15800 TaxID=1384057 RepID=A0A0A3HQ51_9BACL|nr:Rrf2 family transcriptional regulator [Ureibacillus sinduriensis]KGR74706.1 Rrf2 family transcriptional regulator [Ureibacillus sinduriensis BLB-1 = JCM 15800]
MRLTLYTDYSLRVLLYLGIKGNDRLSTIQEIADSYHISKNHLMKVTYDLGQLGLIETIRGRGGGIRLKAKPEDINIGQVVRHTEEDFHLVECFDPKNNLCKLSPACKLKFALNEALDAYLKVLDQYNLADFLVAKEEMFKLLGLERS